MTISNMRTDALWISVSRFLGREAALLDSRDWDAWLDLYTEDAEYWVPAWDDDGQPTANPQREISLIYYPNRGGLEDRVFRIRTGRSACPVPSGQRFIAAGWRGRGSWSA